MKVSPTWQRYTITGVAPEDDANAGLHIFFAGNGELWINNVSAKVMGTAETVAARSAP